MRVELSSNKSYLTQRKHPTFGLVCCKKSRYIIDEIIIGCSKSEDSVRQSMGKEIQEVMKLLESKLDNTHHIDLNPRLMFSSGFGAGNRLVYDYKMPSEAICIAPFMRRDIELITQVNKFLNSIKETISST